MKAVILAAGIGARLGDPAALPKALLRFADKSLLARHLEALAREGIEDIVIGTGYRAEAIEAELARLGASRTVRTVHNPRFREGSNVTLWTLREHVAAGEDLIVMDADVLCDRRMISRLARSRAASCLLVDRDFEPGDEPVKVGIREGTIVEFRKAAEGRFDTVGESVGFFRFAADAAGALAAFAERYVAAGALATPYEEAIRDLLLAEPGLVGYEDVTGLPWIEIDFPTDVHRAEREVLPRLTDE
jgi:choline kinase